MAQKAERPAPARLEPTPRSKTVAYLPALQSSEAVMQLYLFAQAVHEAPPASAMQLAVADSV